MSLVYYEDQLQALWKEMHRSSIYISEVKHEVNCSCCYKVPVDGNGKRKKSKK